MKLFYFGLFSIAFFLCSYQGNSQNLVKGNVLDQNRQPVAFANVVLLQANDSTTVYKGSVSDEDGNFLLENIADNSYLLTVSFVGFENLQKLIEVNGDENLGELILNESASDLAEVTITAKNPTVTKTIDRLIFNVENSTLSTGNSWDILKRTPGVIVSNNQLLVRNTGVVVYINDRKVQLSASELQQLLESYSASNIKSVEVITNPPARYEAEGGAVLNIVTSTNLTPGYKGSLNGSYSQAIYSKFQFGTSHYFKTEKLNLFANYSFSPRKDFKNDDSHINFINENGEIFSRWNTDFERTTRSRAHNANLILDYNLDEKNTLSFSTNAMFSPNRDFQNRVMTEITDAQFQLDSTFFTRSSLESDQSNIALNLKFTHQLDKEGANISADAHYTNYSHDRVQDILTTYYDPQEVVLNRNSFSTDAAQEINIVTGQVDYTTPIGETAFEMGAKASVINSDSGIEYLNTAGSESLPIEGLADSFLYDENIYAGYTSIARNWEKWAIKAGLRGEFTDRTGLSRSMEDTESREYFDLFPTFYLQHQFSEDHILTFDYGRRITRPRYETLNPFRYFLNENNFTAGNPELRAAISDNFNLNYTLLGQYFFDAYYRDNGNIPENLSFQDNQNLRIRTISQNLIGSKSYGLDFSHGRSFTNFWYFYGAFSAFHEENTFLAVESGNVPVTNEVDAFYTSLYNSFTLSKDGTFSGELTFLYISDFISGSYNLDPFATLSAGLRKTLWNERAELSLNFEDILNTTNTRLTSRYLNQDNSFLAREETQFVRIGFKYNFGNFRLEDNQRNIEAAERDRI